MKEINKLSELVGCFLLDIEKKMERENKDIKVYDVWDEIVNKENMSIGISLEDVKNGTLIVHARHPGMAQQIRLKTKKILSAFKEKVPNVKVNKIKIVLKDDFNSFMNDKNG